MSLFLSGVFSSWVLMAFSQPYALTGADLASRLGVMPLTIDSSLGVALVKLTPEIENQLGVLAHEVGRCGGFERIEAVDAQQARLQALSAFVDLQAAHAKALMAFSPVQLTKDPAIELAVSQVRLDHLRKEIEWMSSFPSRFHGQADPNAHVSQLAARLEQMARDAGREVKVEMISHRQTRQKTLRARIEGQGKVSRNEIVALGAHFDSINRLPWGDTLSAPGSDDDASGSSNLIEVYRILLTQPIPDRTVEFFWYAGEEGGLLGSSEVAASYKAERKDVVGVLQLDMTLTPGSGEGVMVFITDNVSPWLTQLAAELNRVYVGATVRADRCSYACSDHASWFKNGFPSVMPFEAMMEDMNHEIHTPRDVIRRESNFEHSAQFARLGVAYALTLANSSLRQP